jgi:hypothetical protein
MSSAPGTLSDPLLVDFSSICRGSLPPPQVAPRGRFFGWLTTVSLLILLVVRNFGHWLFATFKSRAPPLCLM